MRRLIDVLALGLVIGSIALQGAFLTAIRGVPGAGSAQLARSAGSAPPALSAKVCGGATDRKC
ncbi:MAG: hypothetical protein HZB56_03835 [Deltaproteobacteria bacterium]|nr:hypothetical protein [Deltaproteobacteria bacterium]